MALVKAGPRDFVAFIAIITEKSEISKDSRVEFEVCGSVNSTEISPAREGTLCRVVARGISGE